MTKLHLERTPPAPVNGERTDSGNETDIVESWTPERYAVEAVKSLRQAWRDYLASQTATDVTTADRLYQLHLVAVSRARTCYRCAGYSLHGIKATREEREWFSAIEKGA